MVSKEDFNEISTSMAMSEEFDQSSHFRAINDDSD